MAILTIITATSATIKTAKSIYNAPEELESLLNDLSEAEIIVENPYSFTSQNVSLTSL